MKKQELVRIWKQLDKATEAIEKLQDNDIHDDDGYLFSVLVSLKQDVEELIESKTRTNKFEGQ